MGAHLVAGLTLLSRGPRLSRLSLGRQVDTHSSLAWPRPTAAAGPWSWQPLPGPGLHPCWGACSPHLQGAPCSPASQVPHQFQARPRKIRRVSHTHPVLGDPRLALLAHTSAVVSDPPLSLDMASPSPPPTLPHAPRPAASLSCPLLAGMARLPLVRPGFPADSAHGLRQNVPAGRRKRIPGNGGLGPWRQSPHSFSVPASTSCGDERPPEKQAVDNSASSWTQTVTPRLHFSARLPPTGSMLTPIFIS